MVQLQLKINMFPMSQAFPLKTRFSGAAALKDTNSPFQYHDVIQRTGVQDSMFIQEKPTEQNEHLEECHLRIDLYKSGDSGACL